MSEHDLFRQWRDRKYGCVSRQDFVEVDQFEAWQARAEIADQRISELELENKRPYEAWVREFRKQEFEAWKARAKVANQRIRKLEAALSAFISNSSAQVNLPHECEQAESLLASDICEHPLHIDSFDKLGVGGGDE